MRRLWNRLAGAAWFVLALPAYAVHLAVGLLLLPVGRLVMGRMTVRGIGHLALNTELFFRCRRLADRAGARRPLVLLIAGDPANEQLLRMWSRTARLWRAPRLYRLLHAALPLWKTSPFFDPLDMWSNEYDEFQAEGPTLSFTSEEIAEGERGLRQMGIRPDKDWFVCVFARDANYVSTVYGKHDWTYHDFRDADIATFGPAAQAIADRGGFVLRMGSHATAPMPGTSDRIIDYALSPFRSDFMDIYLAAHCCCFIGSMSGIDAIATIFDRPRLAVNTVPFGHAPWGKDSLFIPKLLVSTATGEPYTFGHLLRAFKSRFDPKLWNGNAAAQEGYRYVDNTPDEILTATVEMLDRLDGRFVPTVENEALQRRYFELVPPDHWSVRVRTPIGAGFLRSHEDLLVP